MFHPAIERFLTIAEATSPGATRARRSLDTLLRWVATVDDPWRGSTLSMPGFPVETAFSTVDDALRYCVEIADPRSDPRHRLTTAADLLTQLSPVAIEPDLLTRLVKLQSRCSLKYGAWIGGRHDAVGDRFKLYAEVPADAKCDADDWYTELSGSRHNVTEQTRVEMIGYDVAARRIEFYRRGRNLVPASIREAMSHLNLKSEADAMFDLLRRAYRFSLAGRLPSSDCGYSESISLDKGPTFFSLYFFARSMFGGDGNIRANVLRLATEFKWDLAAYERTSEPLVGVVGPVTQHGMFGLTIGPQSRLAMTLGLVPPVALGQNDQRRVEPRPSEVSAQRCPASR